MKSYKASMGEQEQRRLKQLEDESLRARHGKKEVLQRERAIKARHDREEENTDQSIVHSLYALEVKLKVGADRARHMLDQNVKLKAQDHNKRIEEVKVLS